jgi:hypothetical protein
MREIVIVIADLYLQAPADATAGAGAADGPARAPGIEQLARFGERGALTEGWRAWTARWLGVPQYARELPASVAAADLGEALADRAVWIATPVHLTAGLTSVHADRRSVLRLHDAELKKLAESFRETFHGSGFELHPLASGELLLSGRPAAQALVTIEPARMLLTSMAEALPAGDGASALRRLGAEIEMWLHGHPVNDERARRGAPSVATLWLWGGGAAAASPAAPPREITAAAFGSDAYVRGLWRLAGGETRPMPVDWASVIGEPRTQRAIAVVEVAELLHANPSWHLPDAVAQIDLRLISPSLAALRQGELDRLVLLANDRSLALQPVDRWRFWRRMRKTRGALEVLA